MDSLGANVDRLTAAMQLLDWQRGFRVAYFMDRHLSAYLAVEQQAQLLVEHEDCFLMFHLSRKEADRLDVECPAGMQLKPLRRQHAVQVNEAWLTRHEGSLAWFEHVIESNPSVGLFRVDSGELVGWTLK